MLKRLYPKQHYKSVFEIDYDRLLARGIKGLMFDIDNTLVAFDQMEATQEIEELFCKLKNMGFKLSLVSNNSKKRVAAFNEALKVIAIPKASKPRRKNLFKAMRLMGTDIYESAFIGDQIFTDVWAGNRIGVYTILVTPIQNKEQWITKIKRNVEAFVINKYKKERRDE